MRIVSILHRGCGNQPLERSALALPLGLVVKEEESLVLLDGSADRAAKLVQVEFFLARSEVAAGVERSVAEELKQRSVNLVRS